MSKEKEDQEPDNNNPKPQTFTPSKKVFDVVRPGKSPASATSRPVISSHKPNVPDDQFVPSANTRLASNPSEKRPLLDGDRKLAISPLSGKDVPEQEFSVAEPAPESTVAPVPVPEDKNGGLAEPQETPELLPEHFDDSKSAPQVPPAERPTLEQLAVEQVVETEDELPPHDSPSIRPDKPMTQDDVLAATDAPALGRAVISHHKHRTKLWEWLLIFVLIVSLALIALNFLLDAEVLTIDIDIPHTDLL